MKLFTVFLSMLYGILACNNTNGTDTPDPGNNPPEEPQEVIPLYERNTKGYKGFRIPAIVKTKEGTLLAFAEARTEHSDSGNIDLIMRRSEDNGETWGDMITVWDAGENTGGNPVPVVDENTGTIHLLMSWNHGEDDWGSINNDNGKDTRRIFHTSSEDDGLTWGEPDEITSDIKKSEWRWYGTGPVHGIQIKEGDYKGRLVIPSYFSVMEEGELKRYSHMIISDDGGQTWKPGNPTPQAGVGECTIAELPEGKIMLNMRSTDSFVRKVSISEDGGETWSDIKSDNELIDPKNQGSLLSSFSDKEHKLFFSNAASTERENMTVQASSNEGESWDAQYKIHAGPSAYSDMVIISEDKLAILYEGGEASPYERIAFEIISLDEFE